MLFNSLTFVVFFAVVVTAYWSMRSWNARKNLLVIASYIFYGAWNPPFAALLFSTTAMDFWLGARIAKAKGRHARRAWLIGSVCMNLSMLGFFKYGNFLLQNFQWLLARLGIIYQPPHLDILLPVGISFYTFHSLSYTLDVYRGVLHPRSRCAISSWPFRFFHSWSPDQSCVLVIFFRNSSGRRVYAPVSFCGDCCS